MRQPSFLAFLLLASFCAFANDMDELRKLQAEVDGIHAQQVAEGRKPAAEDTDSWVAARESGYVNCLLTVLGEGPKDSVVVARDNPLPDLRKLAEGNPGLYAWTTKLKFRYEELSSAGVISILMNSFRMRDSGQGSLKTVLVKNDGSPLAVMFKAEKISEGIRLSVLRIHGR